MKIVVVAGIERSGGTWQYNVVRLSLIAAGYKVRGGFFPDWKWEELDCLEEPCDFTVVKIHGYSPHLVKKADMVFLSDRCDKHIVESYKKFRTGHKIDIRRSRNNFNKWAKHSDYTTQFNEIHKNPIAEIRRILDALGLWSISEFDIYQQMLSIKEPDKGDVNYYDPVTLLHPHHKSSLATNKSNFVLSGLGSSASKFLAKIMNRSKSWKVEHEGARKYVVDRTPDKINFGQLNKHLDRNNYGDVNGFLRYHLHQIRVKNKGILLRDMREIFCSWYSHFGLGYRPKSALGYRFVKNTAFTIYLFEAYIKAGVPVYYFDEYTTDPKYLNKMMRELGITDVTVKAGDLKTKVNQHNKDNVVYEDIPVYDRVMWDRITGEFNNKYILNRR